MSYCPRDAVLEMLCAAANHKDQRTRIISSILPLSLVRHLVGKLDHPGPRAKLKELDPPKELGE